MKPITDDIYNKLAVLGRNVKQELHKKGFVIPVQNQNGSISFGKYTVVHRPTGFYSIVDSYKEPVADHINLPHTAILVANRLALGKDRDDKLLQEDRDFGYADFEEQIHKRALTRKNSTVLFDVSYNKYLLAKEKRKSHKNHILSSFRKLVQLI
jgi:hypothetical protein